MREIGGIMPVPPRWLAFLRLIRLGPDRDDRMGHGRDAMSGKRSDGDARTAQDPTHHTAGRRLGSLPALMEKRIQLIVPEMPIIRLIGSSPSSGHVPVRVIAGRRGRR